MAPGGFAVVAAVGWPLLDVAVAQTLPPAAPVHNLSETKPLPGAPNLNPKSNGRTVHLMPTVQGARALAKARALAPLDAGPLVYRAGGSIMQRAKLYAIFWIPAALQNGGSTGMPARSISKWTCGPVEFPVLPSYPMTVSLST